MADEETKKALEKKVREKLPNLTDDQISIVIELITTSCPYCFINDRDSCLCWNDE